MAYVNVLYVPRLGSYPFEMLIEDYTIDNTELFQADGLGWYANRDFIKPVGFIAPAGNNQYNVCVMAKLTNSASNCIQWYQVYSGHSYSYASKQGGVLQGSITPENYANINFYNVIPWFNNIDDASKYSRGDEFNVNSWIGGLDVRVQYNWQSVPSISGKNGILSLAQIKEEYIEDGEPTSSAEATCFDNLLRVNKVATLIEASLPEPEIGGTTVTVSYLIEATLSGSYTYCKLVAKRNKIPNDVTDGDKIIDLDPTKTSVTIKNLRGLTKYYFVIFVKDSNNLEASSEPKSITTGEAIEIPFFTDSFNSDLMKDGWDLLTYKSEFGNGSTMWAPTSFSSDFLSTYNFLIGNYNRDRIVEDNGILRNESYNHGASDSIYWIPIDRVHGKIRSLEWDYCNLRSVGGSYDAIAILIGWVDSNNEWHQATVSWVDRLWSSEWQHGEYTDLSIENPYIDYIGIYTCDGQPACKNIKFTIE